MAATALRQMKLGTDELAAVGGLLDSDDPKIRQLAVQILIINRKSDESERLKQLLRDRKYLVEALVSSLGSSEEDVRRESAVALGLLKERASTAVTALIKTLTDRKEPVRIVAIQALGQIGVASPDVLKALQRRISRRPSAVSDAAKAAVEQLKTAQKKK